MNCVSAVVTQVMQSTGKNEFAHVRAWFWYKYILPYLSHLKVFTRTAFGESCTQKNQQTSSIYIKGGALTCVSEKENEVVVEHRHEIVSLQKGNRGAISNSKQADDQELE